MSKTQRDNHQWIRPYLRRPVRAVIVNSHTDEVLATLRVDLPLRRPNEPFHALFGYRFKRYARTYIRRHGSKPQVLAPATFVAKPVRLSAQALHNGGKP